MENDRRGERDHCIQYMIWDKFYEQPHVENKHLEFFNAYVVEFADVKNNLGSQSRNVKGNKVV